MSEEFAPQTRTVTASEEADGTIFFREAHAQIPERMRGGMIRYAMKGIKPGEFLTAVIDNDLQAAVAAADPENVLLIGLYATWFRWLAPEECHGSRAKRIAWTQSHAVVNE